MSSQQENEKNKRMMFGQKERRGNKKKSKWIDSLREEDKNEQQHHCKWKNRTSQKAKPREHLFQRRLRRANTDTHIEYTATTQRTSNNTRVCTLSEIEDGSFILSFERRHTHEIPILRKARHVSVGGIYSLHPFESQA